MGHIDEATPNSVAKPVPSGTADGPGVFDIPGRLTPDQVDPPESDDEPPRDLEGLHQVSTGPAYSAFSKRNKRLIIAMVSISSFISPMTQSIYFPAINPIADDLGVSVGLINLTITTYMIMQGISPTIFGDLGDMAGRRPAFIIAFSIYVAANIGLALQDNYAALLALRCLQSAGSSGTIALGFAVVADVAVSAERGKYMGFVGAGIQVGPSLGPVLGGIITQFLGWRAIFWFCAIITVVWLVPYILVVPETSRKVVGNGSIPPRGCNMTLLDYIHARRHPSKIQEQVPKRKFYMPNPFKTLGVVFEKDVGLLLFYNSLLYLMFMLVIASMSPILNSTYHLSQLQIGLCYLPYGSGCFLAAILQGYILDWNYRRIARSIGMKIDMKRGDDLSKFPIEKARVQPITPLLAMGVLSTIGYGWVVQTEQSLGLVLFFGFLIGLTVNGSFSMMGTLLVDLYPYAPATAVAANNLVRCSMGAIGMSIIDNMIHKLGPGWCYTFWALLCAALSPILLLLMRRGPTWREERRLRMEKVKQEEAERSDG